MMSHMMSFIYIYAQVQVATPTVAEQPTTHRQPLSQSLSEPDVISDSDLPLDWALKTKVHFVSPFPFSWTQSLKPHQEASGITQFMGCNSSERVSVHWMCDEILQHPMTQCIGVALYLVKSSQLSLLSSLPPSLSPSVSLPPLLTL